MFLEHQNQHIRMISEGSCDTEDCKIEIYRVVVIIKTQFDCSMH